MMTWIRKTEEYIREHRLIEPGETLIAGVSGGVDSVCLLEALCELADDWRWQLHVVHVNHGLRGEAADADERFVQEICAGKGISCHSVRVDVPAEAAARGIGAEECGRILRREIMEETLRREHADRIVLAHHRDDSVETVLFNLCRGTGIRGLAGIRPADSVYVRPLLWSSRAQIEAFAAERGLAYREDETNREVEYMRNRIRHEVLPLLTERVNDRTVEHIDRASAELAKIDDYLEQETDKLYAARVTKCDDRWLVSGDLRLEPEVLTARLIQRVLTEAAGNSRDITSAHIEAVRDLLDKTAGKRLDLPGQVNCLRTAHGISVHSADSGDDESGNDSVPQHKYRFAGRIVAPDEAIDVAADPYTKYFDYDIIGEKCTWRTRRSGDYIVVRADGSRQKLKDWFINQKIPAAERDRIILLADGDHVYWIVGYRQAEDCLITEKTNKIIEWRAERIDG